LERAVSRRLATGAFALTLAGAAATVAIHGSPAAASPLALDGVPHIMQTVASAGHAGSAAAAGAVPLT
jgi:hypothetical protein